jgi:hypothetical protein
MRQGCESILVKLYCPFKGIEVEKKAKDACLADTPLAARRNYVRRYRDWKSLHEEIILDLLPAVEKTYDAFRYRRI